LHILRKTARNTAHFLKFSGRNLLADAGKISHDKALKKAHDEYSKRRYGTIPPQDTPKLKPDN